MLLSSPLSVFPCFVFFYVFMESRCILVQIDPRTRLFCYGFSTVSSVSFLQDRSKRRWQRSVANREDFSQASGVLGIGNDFRAIYSNVKKNLSPPLE